MQKMNMWCSAVLLAVLSQASQAQILIGQTAGFTGTVSPSVNEAAEGAKLYINNINAAGGVNGQKIELISLDDKFDPKLALENGRQLIEDKNVLAMFLTRGTPQTEALLPLLDKYGVPLIGPSSGAMVFHKPVKKRVFNVRGTYQHEVEKAVAYLHSRGITRIGVVYADDNFGADGVTGAQNGLAAVKLTATLMEKFNRTTPDFAVIATRVVRADLQAVLMVASGQAVIDGVKAFRTAGSSAQIVTLSNNASGAFVKSMGDNARGLIITQAFPNENSVAVPMVKEARDMAKVKGINEVSPAMLEGFAAAKVLVESIRRAGPKPTRDKLQAALENLRKFDLGGLEVSYTPDDHTGLEFADLSIIGNDLKFKR